LLGLGAVLRADDFMIVPRLTDETQEVMLGLRLAREGIVPLVGVQPYTGGMFSGLVGMMFLAVGPKIEAGRLVALLAGTLTILPTWLLARELATSLWGAGWRSSLVGLLAGLLLAVSGPHVVTSSRIAYSNSLTPLFTMTGLWLVQRSLRRRSALTFIEGGVTFGLAIQTHVSALTLGPGVAVALLLPMLAGLRRGEWSAFWPRPWALLVAGGGAVLMILNILVYNLTVQSASVGRTELRIGRYVGADPWSLDAWGGRLLALLKATALAIGSQISEVDAPATVLGSPQVLVAVGLALVGLWLVTRRGLWLPLCVAVSVLLFVSLLNSRIEPIVPRVRHYATLVPLGMVLIAVAAGWLQAHAAGWHRAQWAAQLAVLLVPLALGVGSLVGYHDYKIERLTRPEKNNRAYLAVLKAVTDSGSTRERVYLDDRLQTVLTLSGGRMLTHLRYGFLVTRQEYEVVILSQMRLPVGERASASRRVILSADSVPVMAQLYRLLPLPHDPGEGAPVRAFRVFPPSDATASTPVESARPARRATAATTDAAQPARSRATRPPRAPRNQRQPIR
jgi:hypothetical protein